MGAPSCSRPRRGEKEGRPRNRRGRTSLEPQLSPAEGGQAGVPHLRGPCGVHTPGNPQCLGKKGGEQEQTRTEGLTWTGQGTLQENFRQGERGPPSAPHLAPRKSGPEPRSPRPAARALPASGAGCTSRALRGPWSWKVGVLRPGTAPASVSVSGRRARLPYSPAELEAAARLGVGRPVPLRPSSPSLPPLCLYLPQSDLTALPPPLSLAHHLSLHPSSLAFLLPPPLPPSLPPGGAGLLPSLPDKAVAAHPLRVRAQAASASSGLGWRGRSEGVGRMSWLTHPILRGLLQKGYSLGPSPLVCSGR